MNKPDLKMWPKDLGEWVSEDRLVRLALEAAQIPSEASLSGLFYGEGGKPVSAKMMLTLLTYSYSRGIYSSEEIERLSWSDPAMAYLAANQFPGWNVIRRFRRLHRGLLRDGLNHVLGSLACAGRAGESAGSALDSAAAVCLTRREADDRIRRAMQADSMAMDV